MVEIPLMRIYEKRTLPENPEEKAIFLKRYIGRTVLGNFNQEIKQQYTEGILFQNKTSGNFFVRYEEQGKIRSQRINMNNLEELLIKANLINI